MAQRRHPGAGDPGDPDGATDDDEEEVAQAPVRLGPVAGRPRVVGGDEADIAPGEGPEDLGGPAAVAGGAVEGPGEAVRGQVDHATERAGDVEQVRADVDEEVGDVEARHGPALPDDAAEPVDEVGTRLGVLAERARVAKQTAVSLVDHLVAAGYVERVPDADGRARLVRLTPRGESVLPAARAGEARVEREWREVLGARRLADMRSALEEILEASPPA